MPIDLTLPPPTPLPTQNAPGDGPLRPHQPNCFGCGPENAAGLQLAYARDGDVVRATVVLDRRHEGAPGLSHGGAVAALLDDIQGGILMVLHQPAVTARLEVEYVAPVVLGRELQVEGWLVSRRGRKLELVGRVLDGERVVALSRGLFVTVDREHFRRAGAGPTPAPQIGT